MPDFSRRSHQEELLDQENIETGSLHRNLYELEVINQWLGGHRATLMGLKKLMKDKEKTYTIVDFACGGGDTLRIIEKWAIKKQFKVNLIGFDLLEDAIVYAKKNTLSKFIRWEVKDFNAVDYPNCDIAICSLVCHHFYAEKLKAFLQKMMQTAKLGVVINDLHRNPLAYYGIAILTNVFSKSHMVKHDAKLSVLKGFTKGEWKKLLQEVNARNYSVEWVWAFRHLILIKS